jgi:glycosyltransferase involved in cell wall biosynthesis
VRDFGCPSIIGAGSLARIINMPVLSILIPTKSNAATIRSTVESARAVAISDAEIVIQDCGTTDESERQIRNIADGRLRYFRSPAGISMTANWNSGITNCHGRYICIVGGDDGVSPYLAEAVEWAVKYKLSAIVPSFIASYAWPGVDKRRGETAGVLTIATSCSGKASRVSAREALEAYCSTGADYNDSLRLPSLYRCLVSRTLLNSLREYTSCYIGGAAPDVYSAVALARLASEWVHLDYPLFLPGWASESYTARHARRQDDKALKKNSHTKEYCSLAWPCWVPDFAVTETLTAESTLRALTDLDCAELLRTFNYGALYGRCLLGSPSCWAATLKCLALRLQVTTAGPEAVAATTRLGTEVGRYCCRRVMSSLQYRLKKTHALRVFTPVQTVAEAVETLRAAVPGPTFQ